MSAPKMSPAVLKWQLTQVPANQCRLTTKQRTILMNELFVVLCNCPSANQPSLQAGLDS